MAKHMVVGYEKTGVANAGSMVVYRDATNYDTITAGSALTGAKIDGCNRVDKGTFDVVAASACGTFTGTSSGSVKIGVKRLQLPIQNLINANPIELIKRGLASDLQSGSSSPLITARYFYKPGIRITLTDYQVQLPKTVLAGDPPSAGTGPYGGVQLDGPDPWLAMNVGPLTGNLTGKTDASGNLTWYYQLETSSGKQWPIPRGYQPKIPDATNGRPTGARVNGFRIHGWIKIELVKADGRTLDITQEILNLGVTVPYQADTSSAFYYPRATPGFATSTPSPTAGPYPDENSILHLQRFAVPYTTAVPGGLTAPPALDTTSGSLNPSLDVVGGGSGVNFDYYSSMSMRAYNNSSITMYGIEDQVYGGIYVTRFKDSATNSTSYAEPQQDQGGYYTDAVRAPAPAKNLTDQQIDFTGNYSANRAGTSPLGENVNLPKTRNTVSNSFTNSNGVWYQNGETTWMINNRRLVPFPINLFDSREGLPHERSTGTIDTPIPGLEPMSVTKNGTMNLVELDMANLGRMLKGDFDNLFSQMTDTPYRTATGLPLRAVDMRDNININLDNGWLLYISDRRGDEPVLATNPNIKTGTGSAFPVAGTTSMIGDGEYNREDVIWNPGGNTTTGNPDYIQVKTGADTGCTTALVSDGKDAGKSPQDSNNDCFIQRETTDNYSETASYPAMFNSDQYDPGISYSDLNGLPVGSQRVGNMIAMTEVGTNQKTNGTIHWSVKPPVMYQSTATSLRIEMFRRAVRLVNGNNLFPTGVVTNPYCTGIPLGITVTTENPVYVFGNYNVPVGAGIDSGDAYPGLSVTPVSGTPTSPGRYNGQNFATCGNFCHVPAAIIADAVTLLSGPCVGTTNTNWSGTVGFAGWMDARSFVMPYQALGYRSARNSVYRFALIGGYTPSWYPTFWGNASANQGPTVQYTSGAINNFPRFLEDWKQSDSSLQSITYAGSLIQIFKSRQANGAFKRNANATNASTDVDYVYRPGSRDWIFDMDFNNPCTLPPGSPFLQLIDFKGFQQSVVQR